jgi:hypothetical protein
LKLALGKKNARPYPKKIAKNHKGAGGVAQVVEHLPIKSKTIKLKPQ